MKENIKKDGCFVEIKDRNDKEILMKRTTLFCIIKDELKNLRSDDDDAIFIIFNLFSLLVVFHLHLMVKWNAKKDEKFSIHSLFKKFLLEKLM